MLTETQSQQTKAFKAKNSFAMRLHVIFTDSDISEEKLRNASGVSELASFKGYDSKLVIYSFKTEFEKLIQPTIQKRHWVDILKIITWLGQCLLWWIKPGKLTKFGID